MNPWIWQLIIIILAIAFVPLIISGTAVLITSVIHSAGETIHSLIRPFSMSGDARLEGVIRLCLYLIAITFLARLLFGNRGDGSE